MSAKQVIGVRVDPEILARVDAVAPRLAAVSGLLGVTPTRSEVLRAAVRLGLTSLEERASSAAEPAAEV